MASISDTRLDRRTVLAGTIPLLLLGSSGAGHAQTPYPIITRTWTRDFSVQKRQLWGLLSRPRHLELVHSFIRENPVGQWPGDRSVDRLLYHSGLTFERRFQRWIEGAGYDLTIVNLSDPASPTISEVQFRVAGAGDAASELSITLTPVFPATVSQDEAARIMREQLGPQLDVYFPSLFDGIAYHLATGRPVRRDQFRGPLPPYS